MHFCKYLVIMMLIFTEFWFIGSDLLQQTQVRFEFSLVYLVYSNVVAVEVNIPFTYRIMVFIVYCESLLFKFYVLQHSDLI